MKTKHLYPAFIFLYGILLFFVSCKNQMHYIPLKKANFSLKLPYQDETSPFGKVKSIKMDALDNLYILDSEKLLIFKFDEAGNFLNMFGGEGQQCGKLSYPAGMDLYKDSLLIVQNSGAVDIQDINGNCINRFYVRGNTDVSVSPNGTIVLNRMNASMDLGFAIETYNLNGKQLNTFGTTRGKKFKDRNADIAFTGFTGDNHLVYVPAFLDSIFIYDLNGNIIKKERRAIQQSITSDPDMPLEFMVEDIYVENDRIFILRADNKKSNDQGIYVRDIAEYNLNLEFVQMYKLPESITMSMETLASAPWYHKFLVKDSLFIFMVSKPVEHLVAYTPGN